MSSTTCKQLTFADLPTSPLKRCIAINRKNGKPCSRWARAESVYCTQHEPEIRDKQGKCTGKKFESVEQYLDTLTRERKARFYDHGELTRIGRLCGMKAPEVRAALKRCGYTKNTNRRGITEWLLEK